MKKFEGILICTDLDGTLINSSGNISQENLDAIEYFKANGGLFTFVSGRMPYFASDIYNAIKPNAPFGCINAGYSWPALEATSLPVDNSRMPIQTVTNI